MKLFYTIGLVTGVAAIGAASILAACSSDSSPNTPGTDGGTTTDGNTATDSPVSYPDAGTTDSGGALSCAAYCATIAANCTGSNAQYTDNDTCLAICAKLPVGTAADMGGDTLGCRTYHAGAAGSTGNPTFHCPHAGPTGNSVCSTSTCQAFCELDLANCTGAMAAYPDQNTCMTDCAGYATLDAGEIATTSGNSLNCRIYHMEATYSAALGGAAIHCPHTGPSVDAGPCH